MVVGSTPTGGAFFLTQLAIVQWLGYLAFTQETWVQTPVARLFSDHGHQKAPAEGVEPSTSGSGNRRASIAPRGLDAQKKCNRRESNPGLLLGRQES